jgi:hypothetical protein
MRCTWKPYPNGSFQLAVFMHYKGAGRALGLKATLFFNPFPPMP